MKQAIISSMTKSLQADTNLNKEALNQLTILFQTQTIPYLFQIIADNTLNVLVRLATLIQLKLAVQNRWKHNSIFKNKDIILLTQNQKQYVKNNIMILFLICQEEIKFSKLNQYIVMTVVRYKHKQWMPTQLLMESMNAMDNKIQNVEKALQFVLCVSGAFEKIGKSQIYTVFCKQILPMFENFVGENASPKIIYLLSKIYWRTVNSYINSYFEEKNQLWMNFIALVLNIFMQPFHANANQINKYSNQFYYFQSKKWVTRTVMKLIMADKSTKLNPMIKESFTKNYLKSFIQSILQQIFYSSPLKLKYFQLKTLFYCAGQFPQLLSPFKQKLQYSFLQTYIVSPLQDYQFAKNQPLQYLHKQQDNCWGFTNIRMASIDLWIKLSNNKNFEQNLKWIVQKIKSGKVQELQTGLSLLIHLGPIDNRIILENIPSVFQYLVEKMNSQNTQILIKYRILQLITVYPSAKLSPLLLQHILSPIINILTQPSNQMLIIKSIECLNTLIQNQDLTVSLIQPYINKILQQLLKFISSPDSQDLIPNFYQLINNLKNHLSNYFTELVLYFIEQFLRFSKQYNQIQLNNQTYDGKIQDAAIGCLSIISALLQVGTTHQLLQIESNLIKVIEQCFTQNGLQYYGDGLHLLNVYIFKINSISSSLMFFYPCILYRIINIPQSLQFQHISIISQRQVQIFENIKTHANIEQIQKSFPVLRNYIYKCPQLLGDNNDFFNNKLSDLIIGLIETVNTKSKPQNSYDCIQLLSLWSFLIFIIENTTEQDLIQRIIRAVFQGGFVIQKQKQSYLYLKKMWSILCCICCSRYPQYMIPRIDFDILKDSTKGLDIIQQKRTIIGLSCVLSNENVLNYSIQNNQFIFKILQILRQVMCLGTVFDQMDDLEEDIQFSQRSEDYFVSNILVIDQIQLFKTVSTKLITRFSQYQETVQIILEIRN